MSELDELNRMQEKKFQRRAWDRKAEADEVIYIDLRDRPLDYIDYWKFHRGVVVGLLTTIAGAVVIWLLFAGFGK